MNISTINKSLGLSKCFLDEAYQKNWFKLFVLKKYSGLECSLPLALKIIQYCNKQNGSFGWCVNLGAGANYFSGFFNEFGAFKIFDDKRCVLAGSGGLASEVLMVDGGYLVSGSWGKATGALHATYFTCNGKLPNGEVVSLAIKSCDVKIISDWQLCGMKNSSSFGFSAQKAFVPEDHIFKINKCDELSSYSIHKLPFESFAQFLMAASIIGLAEGIIEKLDKIELKEVALEAVLSLKMFCNEGEFKMAELAEKTWLTLQTHNHEVDSFEIEKMVKWIGKTLFKLVNQVYFDVGLVMADENKPVNTQYKDFMLAIQHSIFK